MIPNFVQRILEKRRRKKAVKAFSKVVTRYFWDVADNQGGQSEIILDKSRELVRGLAEEGSNPDAMGAALAVEIINNYRRFERRYRGWE